MPSGKGVHVLIMAQASMGRGRLRRRQRREPAQQPACSFTLLCSQFARASRTSLQGLASSHVGLSFGDAEPLPAGDLQV